MVYCMQAALGSPDGPAVTRLMRVIFFFSSRRRHTRFDCDWSSDVCSSDLRAPLGPRDRGEGDRGPIDGFLVDAKVRVDRAAYAGGDPAVGERVLQDLAREIGRASCRERV